MKKNAKRIANISLLGMLLGFLSTLWLEDTWWALLIRGGFEAGLVGGLADWFAVTALFRHPLGLAIPHTALLPKNREKITETILQIVENDWLKKETIVEKLKHLHFSKLIVEKTEEKLQEETTKQTIQAASQQLLQTVEKEKVQQWIQQQLSTMIHAFPVRNATAFAIDKALDEKWDEKTYNTILEMAEKKAMEPRTKAKIVQFVMDTIEKKAKNTVFNLVLKPMLSIGRDKVELAITQAMTETFRDLQQPQSQNRQHILAFIRVEMEKLKENDAVLTSLEAKKSTFINSPSATMISQTMTNTLFTKITTLLEDPIFFDEKVFPFITNVLHKLKANKGLMDTMEQKIKEEVAQFIDRNHEKIGTLVRDNLDKLDEQELIDMMENKIGKELAWIRINGAFCGFLIGIVLTIFTSII